MAGALPEDGSAESPELDFTGCDSLDGFLKRVEVVLVQAGGTHQQQHITAQQAVDILDEGKPTVPAHPLSEDQKALIIANAVFPEDEDFSFNLRITICRSSCHNIGIEERMLLTEELIKRGHPDLVQFMNSLIHPLKP